MPTDTKSNAAPARTAGSAPARNTPGPWQATRADWRSPDDGTLPFFVVGPDEFCTVADVRPGSHDDDLPAQTPANARLIAAAPAMLNALRAVLAFHSSPPFGDRQRAEWLRLTGQEDATTRTLCDVVRAAVAQAAGEDPV